MSIPPSDLDYSQCIQGAYDEPNQALRTEVVGGGALISTPWDYMSLNSSGATQDIYTFKSGGSSGTVVNTLTINYVDSSKSTITNVTKT